MATTKTIQPTGETITIPAMADQPDMSVVATDLGNITDAVNAQNQALLHYYDNGKLKVYDSIDVRTITEPGRYYCLGCTNLPGGTGYGYLDVYVYNANYRRLLFHDASFASMYTTRLQNGTWQEWQQLAMKEEFGNIIMLNKSTTTSSGDLTFTVNGRGAGFLIVSQNGLSSSIYEIHTTSNSGGLQFTKIGGRDVSITANDSVLTVSVTNWSNAYVIYGGLIS